jgi:hypothetical protein
MDQGELDFCRRVVALSSALQFSRKSRYRTVVLGVMAGTRSEDSVGRRNLMFLPTGLIRISSIGTVFYFLFLFYCIFILLTHLH